MNFSTDESDQNIIKVALSWLERGFRPCVIYPRGFPKKGEDKDGNPITIPASGKEPFGARWGLKPMTENVIQKDIQQFTRQGMTPGLGLCLGPERAPGGLALMDLEGDSPEAEDSRTKLFGGEVISTIGHDSVRGRHQFFSYDWSRLQPILATLKKYQTKTQPGVYHNLPGLPGLELRTGGFTDSGQLKQLQTVIPPTPGTNGEIRLSNGVDTLAEGPESFYMFLEAIAQVVQEVDPEPPSTNSYHDNTLESLVDEVPEVKATEKKKRGRPKGSGVGDSIKEWLHKQFTEKLKEVANAAPGERHPVLIAKIKYLAGFLYYQTGYSRDDLELAGIEAANKAAPERAGDNVRCVREAISYGIAEPLEVPAKLHWKYIKFKQETSQGAPQPSTNGHGPSPPREPGDDDPEAINGTPIDHNLTDLGNSRRFIDLHGDEIRYVGQWKSWYLWIGDRWEKDYSDKINYLCEDVPIKIRQEAIGKGPDLGTEFVEWALKTESADRLTAIQRVASSNPVVAAIPKQFDRNPWFLNCTNGTVDLATGRLLPHDRNDLILKTTGTEYDPNALCPLWDTFLDRIFNGDTKLIEYVQTLVGYSCIGVTKHNILVFLSGDGLNGKSTLLEAISDTIGEYARTCDPDLLVENRFNNGQDHKIADLFGSRFVYTVEVKDGAKLAEGMVKRITGGDTIKACRKYESPFDFRPTHTVWLAANQAPDIRGRDLGIWRRIKRIPFDVTIPESQIDGDLREKLNAERSGILRWIVDGAAKWLDNKGRLIEPHAVTEAIEEYKEDTDVYGPYFRDYCSHGPEFSCTHVELFEDFKSWSIINNIEKISSNKFARILTSRGYKREKTEEARRIKGIRPNGALKRPGNRWADRDFQTPYVPREVIVPTVVEPSLFIKLDEALRIVSYAIENEDEIPYRNIVSTSNNFDIPLDSMLEAARLLDVIKFQDAETGEEIWTKPNR